MRFATNTAETHRDTPERAYCLDSFSDADLLDAWSRDQHPQALAALTERYSVMVLSVCRRRCRSDADADDAFQTTFLYLARNSSKIRKPERLAGWLHRVAQRAAVATWKSSQRQSEPMVEPPANPDDPFDRLTARHEAIVLDEELADLPDHYRSALVMHIYEDHPLQYLADHFGTTIGSIRGRLQRGKQMLARRLRHRGVVPVLAYASASTWTATTSSAASASESFIASVGEGSLPTPPVEPALLESLLSQGVRLMPTIYTTAGVLGGTALLAMLAMTADPSNGQSSDSRPTLAVAPAEIGEAGTNVLAQFQAAATQAGASDGAGAATASGTAPAAAGTGSFGTAGGGLGGGQPAPAMVWENRPVVPTPTTKVAEKASEALDEESAFAIDTTLSELPGKISEETGVPVLVDERGVKFARVAMADQPVQYQANNVPLRTALRTMLRPHGLRIVVEDEGLVITADPTALVHQGIGTSRWINVDQEAAEAITDQLRRPVALEFIDLPLRDAIDTIQSDFDVPILIDARALEDIGLDSDTPVTLTISGVKLQSALELMLADLELVATLQGESLVITTTEAEESKLLHRVYWLEGTGIAADDETALIELITTTISPDIWYEMGGPSTMAPLRSSRPALLISTSFAAHQSIEKLFETLRESHFGVDPVLERVQVPASQNGGDGFGGGQGGGGFF
jgi:RNA polymerase sigma factor (sigma-70 family)